MADLEAALFDAKQAGLTGREVDEAAAKLDELQHKDDTPATPEATEALMKEAIAMDDGEAKRKKLNLALSKAASLGMAGGGTSAAEAEQKALTERLTVRQSLVEAQEKREVEQLEHALESAKAAGIDRHCLCLVLPRPSWLG